MRILRLFLILLQVMPSMRSMMTAGPALNKCNIAGYNCSYLPIDHPHAFDEVRAFFSTAAYGWSVCWVRFGVACRCS